MKRIAFFSHITYQKITLFFIYLVLPAAIYLVLGDALEAFQRQAYQFIFNMGMLVWYFASEPMSLALLSLSLTILLQVFQHR